MRHNSRSSEELDGDPDEGTFVVKKLPTLPSEI